MIEKAGTYRARGAEVMLGSSRTKGTPFVGVIFTVTDGPCAGQKVKWDGWLTPKTAKRTMESLQHCGWTGDDISVFASGALNGIDRNEVDLVVEMESYQGTDDTKRDKKYPKVQWVNRVGSGAKFGGTALNVAQAAELGARLRGLAMELKQGQPANTNHRAAASSDIDESDLPF